ncbi:hypothetical protein RJ639_000736 [Escallonia herrerae]|uniref:Integrase catalytic domain-containing protein n=1 Tax=Escallonia herrerae TaxID=1293975 RepID=A0AA88X7W4_9ASTE|nr:hypothetical protein RJ639_000736 [Escallonia herrerae]
MAEEGKGKIEKFNGMNFQWWKMQVKEYLYQKDLYLPLVGEKPEEMIANEWTILDRKALATKIVISVSGLDREGYFVAFGEKQWKVTKGSMVVARENQRTTLWHHRLGHLSESGMRILHSKNPLPGMKNILLDFCEGCVYRKQKRVSFQKDGKERKIERLELVHSGVCGPTTLKSLGDDASRKTWIYAIKQKYDVYHTFKKWKVLVENETWNKVKCLKSDNGGEYRDGGFQEYCSRLIRTVKRTPQENGLAERMNRTIMERARSPANALNGGILEEEWSGKQVNYYFLRVFGCIAYAHSDKEERKKLDSKSQKCVFIGYGGDEYGYRLWDYEHNKIIRSRDVIFDESQLSKHMLQEHGIKKEDKEYMELDEPEDGQIPRIESPEVLDETTDTEIGAGDQQQVPETLNLRKSSRDGQLNLEKIEGNKNLADMVEKVYVAQAKAHCYDALMRGEEDEIIKLCREVEDGPLHIITAQNDTILHLASSSKRKHLVRKMTWEILYSTRQLMPRGVLLLTPRATC